jgi:hypothetical protein
MLEFTTTVGGAGVAVGSARLVLVGVGVRVGSERVGVGERVGEGVVVVVVEAEVAVGARMYSTR